MALIKCRECGKEISSLAEACPSCGAPPKGAAKRKPEKTTVVYETSNAGLALGMIGILFGVLGMLTPLSIIFLPLATLCAVIALIQFLFSMSATGGIVVIVAIVCTLFGYAFSPVTAILVLGFFVKLFEGA